MILGAWEKKEKGSQVAEVGKRLGWKQEEPLHVRVGHSWLDVSPTVRFSRKQFHIGLCFEWKSKFKSKLDQCKSLGSKPLHKALCCCTQSACNVSCSSTINFDFSFCRVGPFTFEQVSKLWVTFKPLFQILWMHSWEFGVVSQQPYSISSFQIALQFSSTWDWHCSPI